MNFKTTPVQHTSTSKRLKLLFVATQLPLPADTGGKIRSYNILKHLAAEHDVTFVCTTPTDLDPKLLRQMENFCTRFIPVPRPLRDRSSWLYFPYLIWNFASPTPFGVAKDYSFELARRVRQLSGSGEFDAIVCDFLHASINLKHVNSLPIVLFQHNVEAEIFRRYHLQASNPLARQFWSYQWQKMRKYEMQVMQRVDRCISVSETDRETFERDYGATNVATIDTGVDVDYFARPAVQRIPNRLVFTGSMDWLPNEDAILFFVREIMPLITPSVPDVSLAIVGRRPSAKIRRLGEENPRILVTGRVDDVRPYLAAGELFIVPLRIGGGTRIKIFEAMSSGMPVVSTSIGAEGLAVKHQQHLLLADTAEAFAASVIGLLRDVTRARRIADNAQALVTARFDWKIIARQFAEICRSAKQERKGSPDED